MHQEEISIRTLTGNKDIHIGYSDNDIVIIDSIQTFAGMTSAHVAMGAIAICTSGTVQGMVNGQRIALCRNQVAVLPPDAIVSDVMVSPDFNLKAMFLTNAIIQSFLNEKMHVWNELMYVHGLHVVTVEEEDMRFFDLFAETLHVCLAKSDDIPYRTDVVQALLRAVVLRLCGMLRQAAPTATGGQDTAGTGHAHFQRFLDLLHSEPGRHRSVESYANELCLSPKYLTFVCKKQSGKTANEWIREHVLEGIRYYLKQTDYSVKQISDQMGFPNASFFGKYVKEHFGLTPLQLRNQGELTPDR